MTVTFLALAGNNGVLPAHYTQLLLDRAREKDFGLRDFLDLFNHRLIAQFYKAWEKSRFYVRYDLHRRSGLEGTDPFSQVLSALVGLGIEEVPSVSKERPARSAGLRNRQSLPDELFLYYAGHFSHRPRSAIGLEQMIADWFQVPVAVRQFQGQWMLLRPADRTRLAPGGNNQLGVTAVAGNRVWGIENKIRIRLGALPYSVFEEFLPGRLSHVALGQLVRSYVGPALDFDLQLVLGYKTVPKCELRRTDGMNLGWNTWLFTAKAARDVDDAIFACDGAPTH
jgi:type VI secretion system protein ImpH